MKKSLVAALALIGMVGCASSAITANSHPTQTTEVAIAATQPQKVETQATTTTSATPSTTTPSTTTTTEPATTEPATTEAATVPTLPDVPAGLATQNPALTPGDIDPAVTQDNIGQTICVAGYTAKIRNVSTATKAQVFAEYSITPTPGAYEIDHLIALEIGGSNDIRNLWPEPYSGADNAHDKDAIENGLHTQVCAGTLPLATAQDEIVHWWVLVGAVATAAPEPPPTQPPTTRAPSTTQPGAPSGATAICNDGTYSFSKHRSGTCSRHGGVAVWL